MTGGLLIRPQPFRGESLRGYFLRLADANGLLPEVDLYRQAFWSNGLGTVGTASLERAAAKLGIGAELLNGIGCQAMAIDGTRCRYLGHCIARQHLRGSQCAVCPHCLMARQAVRADWELSSQVVCPNHGCWLIDQCPRCSDAVAWRRRGVATCACGQDLRAVRTQAADQTSVEFGRLIARRLFGDLDADEEDETFPVPLKAASMNQLLGLTHLFGNSRMKLARRARTELGNATGRLRSQVATAQAVASALSDWPRGWHEALKKVIDPRVLSMKGRRLLVSESEAHAPFAALSRASWSAASDYPVALRREFLSFLSNRQVSVGRRRFYSFSDDEPAAVAASPLRFTHLWARSRNGSAIGVDDVLSVDAVRDLFNVWPMQLKALCRAGILPGGRSQFSASEVEAGFVRLTRHTSYRPRADGVSYVPLWNFGLSDPGELEGQLRAVMSGRTPSVTWSHVRPPGLGNLFIPAKHAIEQPGDPRANLVGDAT